MQRPKVLLPKLDGTVAESKRVSCRNCGEVDRELFDVKGVNIIDISGLGCGSVTQFINHQNNTSTIGIIECKYNHQLRIDIADDGTVYNPHEYIYCFHCNKLYERRNRPTTGICKSH